MTDAGSGPELDAETIVATLNRFGVKYVVIGAFAAQLQGAPIPRTRDHDGRSLGRARIWNLTSPFGEVDISFVPSGTEGYDDLAGQALIVESHGESVPVADLDDSGLDIGY